MKFKERKTVTRSAYVELPYDKMLAAAKSILAEQGVELPDVEWVFDGPSEYWLGDGTKPNRKRVWLKHYVSHETDGETEIH